MIDIGAIAVTSSAIARKSPRIAGSFNAICITGITGLLITNAGSLNTDIAICSGIWIAFTIAMEMAIVIVIGTVTMMAVIGNGGRIRQLIGWERIWLSEDLLPDVGTRQRQYRSHCRDAGKLSLSDCRIK